MVGGQWGAISNGKDATAFTRLNKSCWRHEKILWSGNGISGTRQLFLFTQLSIFSDIVLPLSSKYTTRVICFHVLIQNFPHNTANCWIFFNIHNNRFEIDHRNLKNVALDITHKSFVDVGSKWRHGWFANRAGWRRVSVESGSDWSSQKLPTQTSRLAKTRLVSSFQIAKKV